MFKDYGRLSPCSATATSLACLVFFHPSDALRRTPSFNKLGSAAQTGIGLKSKIDRIEAYAKCLGRHKVPLINR